MAAAGPADMTAVRSRTARASRRMVVSLVASRLDVPYVSPAPISTAATKLIPGPLGRSRTDPASSYGVLVLLSRDLDRRRVRQRRLLLAGEGERRLVALAGRIDQDDLTGAHLAEEDLLGQDVFDLALDGAAQRPGTEHGVVALLGEQLLSGDGELEAHVLVVQPLVELGQHQVD